MFAQQMRCSFTSGHVTSLQQWMTLSSRGRMPSIGKVGESRRRDADISCVRKICDWSRLLKKIIA